MSSRGPLGRSVRRRGHTTNSVIYFPDDEMEALRFPSFCFVYDGEADIPVGDAMLHCPAGYAIVIPPGVALSEGGGPHWSRPHLEKATSDILWLHILPFGAQFHLCHTRGAHHESESYHHQYIVPHRRLFPIAEQLIEELETAQPFSQPIVSALLLTILHLIRRHISSGSKSMLAQSSGTAAPDPDFNDPSAVVRRAQTFIGDNLEKPLSLATIARNAYVSRARLAQSFKDQLGQTVWAYVTQRRLQEAKTMLEESSIFVHDIARLCGFKHQSHFFARFEESEGTTPGEYRKRAQRKSPRVN